MSEEKVKWVPGMGFEDYHVDFSKFEMMTQIYILDTDRQGITYCPECGKVWYKPTYPFGRTSPIRFCPGCNSEVESVSARLEKMKKSSEDAKGVPYL